MEVNVKIPGADQVKFNVELNGHGRAFFVLGIRKSGSTLLNRICAVLARVNSVNYVDIAGTFFRNNIPVSGWINEPAVRKALRPGNAYGGFRNLPACLAGTGVYKNAKKVLLVRDPRDALVSEFFSNAYSHSIPASQNIEEGASANILLERKRALESSIQEYIFARAPLMKRTFMDYAPLAEDPQALILRYEDVIFRKREMINSILQHFHWSCGNHAIVKLMDKLDIRPVEENPTAFIRKVTPGDHREKLSREAIERLDAELREPLDFFGYSEGDKAN